MNKHDVLRKRSIRLLMFFIVASLLSGCYESRQREYYADINNYITEEAVVKKVQYYSEDNDLIFWLSEVDEVYPSGDFIIKGDSVALVLENGILEKIQEGDTITYTSAPRYFGDGYFPPIVEIVIDGEELLPFEHGYKNLLKLY